MEEFSLKQPFFVRIFCIGNLLKRRIPAKLTAFRLKVLEVGSKEIREILQLFLVCNRLLHPFL